MSEADNPKTTMATESSLDSDKQRRLKELESIFLDISEAPEDGQLGVHSMRAVQHGESLRLHLQEILKLREPSPEELHLDQLRQTYVDTQFIKAGLLTRKQRRAMDERSDQLQQEYVEAVVGRIARIVDASTPREALEIGQLPPIVRKTSFQDKVTLPIEEFAANHLYLLMDTALVEHSKRREIIEDRRTRSLRVRATSHRGTRVAIGAAIGLASFAPELSFVPRPEEVITHDIELALRGLSGVIIGINLPEYARLRYLDRKHRLEAKGNLQKLSDDREICDLALRIVYGSGRTGGRQAETRVSDRYGTEDKIENFHRLQVLEADFPHMNNDPGGRPYSAVQALKFAARLLVEKRSQLDAIIDPAKSAQEQRALYLELCREIVTQDVRRMKKGLNVAKYLQVVWATLGIVPAVLFPGATNAASDAAALSHDTLQTIRSSSPDQQD